MYCEVSNGATSVLQPVVQCLCSAKNTGVAADSRSGLCHKRLLKGTHFKACTLHLGRNAPETWHHNSSQDVKEGTTLTVGGLDSCRGAACQVDHRSVFKAHHIDRASARGHNGGIADQAIHINLPQPVRSSTKAHCRRCLSSGPVLICKGQGIGPSLQEGYIALSNTHACN